MASAILETMQASAVRTAPVAPVAQNTVQRQAIATVPHQIANPFENDSAFASDKAIPEALLAATGPSTAKQVNPSVSSDKLENIMPPQLFMPPSQQARLFGDDENTQGAQLYPIGLTGENSAFSTDTGSIYPTQLGDSPVEYPLGLVQSSNAAAAIYSQVESNSALEATNNKLIEALA